jgi:HEAT repeat protein
LTPKQKQGLEVEKLQSIAQVDTLNRQLTLLNKKLALTKDLADREKQSTEAPPSKPATDAVKLVPPQAEIDSVPIELPVRPTLNLTSKADPASKLRYNGKPFHAWAETLRDDLSPESRTEAIEALAMFGRFGLAEGAAKEILAAMRDYSVWSMDGSAEGKLKFAATKAFKQLPEKVTRPLLTTALASDSGNQRVFAATVLGGQVRDPKEREKLFVPLLDDTDVQVRRLAAINLQSQADKYLAVVEIMREAIASPDFETANWAVQVVGRQTPQPFVPILPTLVERLDTEEQPLLQQLQMALLRFGPLAIPALEAGEQSDNRRVRAMSQQTLQQIRSAAPPAAGEDSPQKPGTEPAPEASYRNKTFKSWLDTLKRDLSPESRTEAIRALAVFAAHGHAREVGEAILEVMGDYSIFDMSASPDAPLKVAALDAFSNLDRGAAFPLVDAALKSENANRRMFAAVMLDQWVPKDNSLDLDELLADPDPAARHLFARIVVGRDVTNAKALEIVRAGLESSDDRLRSAAIVTANGLISQFNPGQGVEGPVLEALKQLGPALKPIMESAAKSDAPNQAEVQAALRLMSFSDEPKK